LALIKQTVWDQLGCLPDTGRMWLQLIQRSEPKVGQHCSRSLTTLHLLLVIVIILCHLRLTTYGVE
jgi:hypothetical protein